MCANALFFVHLVSLYVTLRMEGVTATAAVLGMRRRVLVAVGLGGHPSLLLPFVPLAGVWGYPLAVSPRAPVPCTFPARMLPHACVAPRSSASVRPLLLLLLWHAGQTGLSGLASAGAVLLCFPSVPRGV